MTIPQVTVDELAAVLAANPDSLLIDVREVHEYVAAHVPGAALIALSTVPDNVDVFRGDGTTYVICRTGARSQRACEFLAAQGLDVANIAGGTAGWVSSGRSVVSGDQPS